MLRRLIRLPFQLSMEEQVQLRRQIFGENMGRAILFAKITIGLESALAIADVTASLSKAHDSFHFSFYFMMYMTMIVVGFLLLLGAKRYDPAKSYTMQQLQRFESAFMVYSLFFVVWGGVVTLADQRLYGQLMAFVVNLVSLSVIFYFSNRAIILIYTTAACVLAIGLPFFQPSGEVLVGHFINLSIFMFFTWVASRILYVTYCRNFYSNVLLGQSNARLEEEIQENRRVHRELERANRELLSLSLVDELTGIPNRRAFEQQVQALLSSQESSDTEVSVIMLDIDFFKQFNDNYGHSQGDEVIRKVAGVIHDAAGGTDLVAARLGGEEFVLAAFHTGSKEIHVIAEDICRRIRGLQIPHERSVIHAWVTGSLGTATDRIRNSGQFADLIRTADEALYAAKAGGRNQVVSMNKPHPQHENGAETPDWEV